MRLIVFGVLIFFVFIFVYFRCIVNVDSYVNQYQRQLIFFDNFHSFLNISKLDKVFLSPSAFIFFLEYAPKSTIVKTYKTTFYYYYLDKLITIHIDSALQGYEYSAEVSDTIIKSIDDLYS